MAPTTSRARTTKRAARPSRPVEPKTLAIDIGGTGLKATVLDANGTMMCERVRVETTYPVGPSDMVEQLQALVRPLPRFDRVSIGFPGVVRNGHVVTAPHFITVHGPGTEIDPQLRAEWVGFDLAGALRTALRRPARLMNDADLQGLGAAEGKGVEVLVTLGTGLGSAVLVDGVLGPHLELAQHGFRRDETYNEQLGDRARKRIGSKKWNRRLARAFDSLQTLFTYDHLYVAGGNTRHITLKLPPEITIVDPAFEFRGALRLWDDTRTRP